MPLLYSYCIPIDDGAAPNPYWGICTLAICKPVIRRTAKVGDWIVGTGSVNFEMQNKVIYAMKVTDIMTFSEYNEFCLKECEGKIPNLTDPALCKRAGDCIYSNVHGKLVQRKGVHGAINQPIDERGKNVLLSEHFYYFGDQPILLPSELISIVKQGEGHKSQANIPYAEYFINWITTNNETKPYRNKLKGKPRLLESTFKELKLKHAATCRKEEGEEDEIQISQ